MHHCEMWRISGINWTWYTEYKRMICKYNLFQRWVCCLFAVSAQLVKIYLFNRISLHSSFTSSTHVKHRSESISGKFNLYWLTNRDRPQVHRFSFSRRKFVYIIDRLLVFFFQFKFAYFCSRMFTLCWNV